MRDLQSRYGLVPATVYRWIAEGSFPLPVNIGENSVAWDSSKKSRNGAGAGRGPRSSSSNRLRADWSSGGGALLLRSRSGALAKDLKRVVWAENAVCDTYALLWLKGSSGLKVSLPCRVRRRGRRACTVPRSIQV